MIGKEKIQEIKAKNTNEREEMKVQENLTQNEKKLKPEEVETIKNDEELSTTLEPEKFIEIDLGSFVGTKSQNNIRSNEGAGAATLINHKNGKRLSISKEVMNKLGSPKNVRVATNGNTIAIGEKAPGCEIDYNIMQKTEESKGIIYGVELVKELTDGLGLDFTGISSITFRSVQYTKFEGHVLAIISK